MSARGIVTEWLEILERVVANLASRHQHLLNSLISDQNSVHTSEAEGSNYMRKGFTISNLVTHVDLMISRSSTTCGSEQDRQTTRLEIADMTQSRAADGKSQSRSLINSCSCDLSTNQTHKVYRKSSILPSIQLQKIGA
jgi:hypothetical protein